MAKLVLPQALGKAAVTYIFLPVGRFHAQDQHVLGQPVLVARHDRGDAQGQALLAEQCVAAVAAAEGPDLAGVREVGDVLVLDARGTGPGHVRLAGFQRRAHRVHAGDEFTVCPQGVQDRLTHAGHDALVDHHIGGVGDLDADVGDGRADRPHAEGDDVEGAPAHAALELPLHDLRHLARRHPVVGGAGLLLAPGADEGPVLHPRHVARMGARQEAVGAQFRVEADEGAALHHLVAQPVILGLRAVAPVDALRLAQAGLFIDPGQEATMGGARGTIMGHAHGGTLLNSARQWDRKQLARDGVVYAIPGRR